MQAERTDTTPPNDIEPQTLEWYAALAERATEQALDMIRENRDASADLSLAAAAWDCAMGFASDDVKSDMDEYVLTDDGGYEHGVGPECTCPPDLVARGGFTSTCRVHGSGA